MGRMCRRRLPRISCLKCFTAMVTKTSVRGIPASASARSRTRPAGPAAEVFLVAGLLAHEHDVSGPAALARHRLRCVLVERAARARVLGLGKLRERIDLRRKLEIKPRLPSHRALLANRCRPLRVNAGPPRQFAAGGGFGAFRDIKKSLYPRCRRWRALL